MAKKSVGDFFVDPPELQVVGCRPQFQSGAGNGRDRQAYYRVRFHTPYGEVGGNVDPLVFEDAKRLSEIEDGVLLTIRLRSETPRGEQYKSGAWFQIDVIAVERIPDDYGKKSATRPASSFSSP